MTTLSLPASTPVWDEDDVLAHAEQVARARTQSRRWAAQVLALPLPQARSFLRRLWEHAGTLDALGPAGPTLVVEEPLAADVAALLARLGIACERVADDGQVRVQLPVAARPDFLREIAVARASERAFGPGVVPGRPPS